MRLETITFVQGLVGALILARAGAQWWLDHLNRQHLLTSRQLPPELEGVMDSAAYQKSIQYTLAKSGLSRASILLGTLLLILVLFSGILPWALNAWSNQFGAGALSMASLLFTIGAALSLASLPLDWFAEFQVEERFGFNTTTQKLWWADRAKGLLLGALLGIPMLWLVLWLFEIAGSSWWFWAWAAFMGFQLLLSVLAPVLILPLFNKFTPLPQGELRERLLNLAERTRFQAQSIQVMDGSKRSLHSNAFFTGFGKFRKIVFFDTLLKQLGDTELEAVLAHEIGHYKRRHIPKMLAASALLSLIGFYALSVLAEQPWFYQAFGFAPAQGTAALLLFGLLAGVASFWLSPLAHAWSRKYEYEADSFAARVMGRPDDLKSALRRLTEKNLSNLTPHPLYSRFYYSHPTLLEREQALTALEDATPQKPGIRLI